MRPLCTALALTIADKAPRRPRTARAFCLRALRVGRALPGVLTRSMIAVGFSTETEGKVRSHVWANEARRMAAHRACGCAKELSWAHPWRRIEFARWAWIGMMSACG